MKKRMNFSGLAYLGHFNNKNDNSSASKGRKKIEEVVSNVSEMQRCTFLTVNCTTYTPTK